MSATYEDGLALARQMARERDQRFEQLLASEAEADRLRRENAWLREENARLYKLAYITIPKPKWLLRRQGIARG